MGVTLAHSQYGKAETRVVRVYRDADPHELVDYNVSVALSGDFSDVHLTGDNANCLTTDATKKLFADLAPRFADRPGGYTRIIRTGWRIGDGAELAILEFIGSELKKKDKKPRKRAEENAPVEKEEKEAVAAK